MTRDDILRMANEACGGKPPDGFGVMFDHDQLERFVALVTSAEREACAVIAFNAKTYLEAAATIRERGQG